MKKYTKDYYRVLFQDESTERLLFQYANLDLNNEANEAIFEILSQRGEKVLVKEHRAQDSQGVALAKAGCVVVAAPIIIVLILLVVILITDGLPIGAR